MSRISFFRSSVVRITLIYVLLFGTSVSIILGFVYSSTIISKTNQAEQDISAELRELTSIYAIHGYSGLVSIVNQRVGQLKPGESSFYLLTDSDFRPLIGNLDRWPSIAINREGWLDFKLDNREGEKSKEFRALAKSFEVTNRFNLLVGQGMKDVTTLKSLVGRALIWSLLLTIILGLVGGYILRHALRSRLTRINQTSQKIMRGDLTRRIHTVGSGDEFDELAVNLNTMLDQIENGMEGVRRVSDNIAHDLKTPLARIKNKVEELGRQVTGSETKERAVDQILSEADGLLSTFNALLRIARIEYSEKRKNFQSIEINSILNDIQELYEPLADEKNQKMIVKYSKDIVILGDRDMLFQAFANLIDNAVKYTPEGGEIQIHSFIENGSWALEIRDNGPGIDQTEHENVIQRFYRVDPSRTTPGSGLGLALVNAVLNLHNLKMIFKDQKPGLSVRVIQDN